MKRCRIFTDANVTPILGPNPEWTGVDDKIHPQWVQNFPMHDLLVEMGFSEMPMIYDGSLNRAPIWVNDDMTYRDSNTLDWSREGGFNQPPEERAVRMAASIMNKANTFSLKSEMHLPFLFDLENPFFAVSVSESDEKRQLVVDAMVKTVEWAKFSAPYSEVGWFSALPMSNGDFLNTPALLDAYRKYHTDFCKVLASRMDFNAPGFYNWDLIAVSPNTWFQQVETTTRILDEFYSYMPRVAVLTPTYQIYNPVYWKQVADLNGKAIPYALWKKQIQFLVDRDYAIYLWPGGTIPTPEILANCYFIASLKY